LEKQNSKESMNQYTKPIQKMKQIDLEQQLLLSEVGKMNNLIAPTIISHFGCTNITYAAYIFIP
jgi:hypothetical protein